MECPNPINNKEGMIKPNPKAHVYTLPRTFLSTQRSDIYPPTNTPNSDDKAMEIVDIGPATEISIDKLSEKRVGNQFFAAHPGVPGTQK